MIHAVAIDDEIKALDIIKNYCSKQTGINLLECFSNPVDGFAYLENHAAVSLVFLDINMGKLNGLEIATGLSPKVGIIITTAYSDYSMLAFERDAIDYLLKPFSLERFNRAITKAKTIIRGYEKINETPKKLVPAYTDVILVKSDHKNITVRLSELLFVEAARNYIILHTTKGKILALNTMKSIESYLLPYQFLRVHKSFIVSFQYIDAFGKNKISVNTKEIPIGESYREPIRDFLSTHSNQI
jgi:DNA-binding LytR/AlgR family response regulator